MARTSWVRHAFTTLTGLPSRLLAFSDDMDGLRKVPDNVPNREMLAEHLGKPLTRIPDPFGTHASFGAHNNARLQGFLNSFGFDYEFASATDYYTSGRFNAALLRVLAVHDEVLAVILPTLGAERQRQLFALPADPPAHRRGDAGQGGKGRPGCRHDLLARPRQRRGIRNPGDRRPDKTAMEGRLGDALARARRRLRNVGQGFDQQRPPVRQNLPHPGQRAALRLHV